MFRYSRYVSQVCTRQAEGDFFLLKIPIGFFLLYSSLRKKKKKGFCMMPMTRRGASLHQRPAVTSSGGEIRQTSFPFTSNVISVHIHMHMTNIWNPYLHSWGRYRHAPTEFLVGIAILYNFFKHFSIPWILLAVFSPKVLLFHLKAS